MRKSFMPWFLVFPWNAPQSGARRGLATVSGAALLLSGCATLVPEAPPIVYDLTAPQEVNTGSARTSRQLLVAEPTAVRFYATDRIVVRDDASTLSYYPQALWSDALPQLFQARLAETLEKTGRVRAVGVPGQGLLIDTRLVPEIRAFEVQVSQDGGATAVVDIGLKVMNDANGRVLATADFAASVPAVSDAAGDGVAALDQAFDTVLSEMTVFVLRRV